MPYHMTNTSNPIDFPANQAGANMDLNLTSHTNHLGFRQYRMDGKDVCPFCLTPYTNEGKGALCPECDDEIAETLKLDDAVRTLR